MRQSNMPERSAELMMGRAETDRTEPDNRLRLNATEGRGGGMKKDAWMTRPKSTAEGRNLRNNCNFEFKVANMFMVCEGLAFA